MKDMARLITAIPQCQVPTSVLGFYYCPLLGSRATQHAPSHGFTVVTKDTSLLQHQKPLADMTLQRDGPSAISVVFTHAQLKQLPLLGELNLKWQIFSLFFSIAFVNWYLPYLHLAAHSFVLALCTVRKVSVTDIA